MQIESLWLLRKSLQRDKTIRAVCEEKFKDFPYGLKLIAENTNCREFTVTKAVVKDPDKELSKWVVERFQSDDESKADGQEKK